MKKVVRTSLVNTPNRRGIKDLNIQFYSHDKNNAGFEFVIKNETDLSEYTAKVLFHFVLSDSTWESAGTIEGNVVKATFNTDLIARCEEVLGFLFLDSENNSLDVFKFKFNVVLSEIDKNEVEKRKIKHVADIEALELVTRSELRDELAKIQVTGGIDLTNYLTTTVAEETYAKKTDLPTPYNDSALSERVTNLENRTDRDTVYNDTEVIERLTTLENKPPVDLSDYALKSELPQPYNDSALVQKIGQLEARVDKDTVYDDSEVKRRLTDLEARPTVTAYNDKPLSDRVSALENKQDNDTVYDDSKLVERVKKLEDKPEIDTSHFLTEEILAEKHFISASDVEQTYLKKVDVPTPVNTSKFITDDILTAKKFVTKDELNTLKPNQTLTLNNNTLSISDGNSVELPVNKSEMRGTGMPNGVVEAPIGATYIDTAKTNGALKWIKTTDGGNTGWKVAEGDTGWVLGWQADKGNNINRMYFRRKNDVVHVKFEPKISDSWLNHECNLILDIGGSDISDNLSIQGFQPLDNIVQTIFKRPIDIPGVTSGAENSEGSQGMGAVILHYLYNNNLKTGLELQIVTSSLGVDENHVNPFSYLTEDEWPVQLP